MASADQHQARSIRDRTWWTSSNFTLGETWIGRTVMSRGTHLHRRRAISGHARVLSMLLGGSCAGWSSSPAAQLRGISGGSGLRARPVDTLGRHGLHGDFGHPLVRLAVEDARRARSGLGAMFRKRGARRRIPLALSRLRLRGSLSDRSSLSPSRALGTSPSVCRTGRRRWPCSCRSRWPWWPAA